MSTDDRFGSEEHHTRKNRRVSLTVTNDSPTSKPPQHKRAPGTNNWPQLRVRLGHTTGAKTTPAATRYLGGGRNGMHDNDQRSEQWWTRNNGVSSGGTATCRVVEVKIGPAFGTAGSIINPPQPKRTYIIAATRPLNSESQLGS